MYANSNGQSLREHLIAVSKVSGYLAKELGLPQELVSSAELAGLLHDVGKATSGFQSYMADLMSFITPTQGFQGPLHHEVSWAVLASGRVADQEALSAVYWHHARPLDEGYKHLETTKDILAKVSPEDTRRVLSLIDSLGVSCDPSLPQKSFVPDLYETDATGYDMDNAKLMAVRSCLLAADRTVSQLTSEETSKIASGVTPPSSIALLVKYIGNLPTTSYCVPGHYDLERYNSQESCVDLCTKAKTSQVNAPAGAGKTLQGVLFSVKRNKRVFWVCPRNAIAEAVYLNILKELRALGAGRSVELYLAGARVKSEHTGTGGIVPMEECTSDIIVTNIDNLTRPMVSNEVADKLYLSLSSDVVFDEYHEFVGEAPLFAAFVHLMRLRNILASTPQTMLLSATPMCLSDLWDTVSRPTLVLPGKGKHYPAAHGCKYRLTVVDLPRSEVPPGGVVIRNSIRNAQSIMRGGGADILMHSKYTATHRAILMDVILTSFGKGGCGVQQGTRVVSAPVLQAALDISFSFMQESALSAEATLQRFGRVKRWGEDPEYVPQVEVLDAPKGDTSEWGAIGAVFSKELRNLWVSHLRAELGPEGKTLTLDELYDLYSAFYAVHTTGVRNYLVECLKEGSKELKECAPTKLMVAREIKESPHRASSKTLRTPDGSFYYVVRTSAGDWMPPGKQFSCSGRELANMQKGTGGNPRSLSDWGVVVPQLVRAGYIEHNRLGTALQKGRSRSNPDTNAHKWSKKDGTPYPAPANYVYDCRGPGDSLEDIGLGLID